MLRRDPTPIVLRDTDVLEVKELMMAEAKAKEDQANASHQLVESIPQSGNLSPEEERKKFLAERTREQRLGLEE